jgi:transposase
MEIAAESGVNRKTVRLWRERSGKVIGDCCKRHRHQEFLKFLRRINREFSGKMPLHLVMDNYGTHGTPRACCTSMPYW